MIEMRMGEVLKLGQAMSRLSGGLPKRRPVGYGLPGQRSARFGGVGLTRGPRRLLEPSPPRHGTSSGGAGQPPKTTSERR